MNNTSSAKGNRSKKIDKLDKKRDRLASALKQNIKRRKQASSSKQKEER